MIFFFFRTLSLILLATSVGASMLPFSSSSCPGLKEGVMLRWEDLSRRSSAWGFWEIFISDCDDHCTLTLPRHQGLCPTPCWWFLTYRPWVSYGISRFYLTKHWIQSPMLDMGILLLFHSWPPRKCPSHQISYTFNFQYTFIFLVIL